MSDYKVTDTELMSVANAIRTKGGTSSQLEWPTGFANAIANISGGGSGSINILSGTSAPTSSQGSNGAIYLEYADSSELPSGYTLLDSVEFSRAQSIDTGILVTTQDLRVVSEIAITNVTTEAIWGGSWSESGFFLMINNGKFRWHSRGKSVDSASIFANQWYKIETNKSKLIVDGTEYTLDNPTGTEASVNLKLGGVTNSQGAYASMALKRTRVYNGTTLLLDLIPVKDSNNVACLYDVVGGTTFYSSTALVANRILDNGKILSAFLKVNGTWQQLVGSDIEDVNTGS